MNHKNQYALRKDTQLNSFLYNNVGELHQIRLALCFLMSVQSFHETNANVLSTEHKQQPSLSGEHLELPQ